MKGEADGRRTKLCKRKNHNPIILQMKWRSTWWFAFAQTNEHFSSTDEVKCPRGNHRRSSFDVYTCEGLHELLHLTLSNHWYLKTWLRLSHVCLRLAFIFVLLLHSSVACFYETEECIFVCWKATAVFVCRFFSFRLSLTFDSVCRWLGPLTIDASVCWLVDPA